MTTTLSIAFDPEKTTNANIQAALVDKNRLSCEIINVLTGSFHCTKMMFVLILSNLHEYTDSFACLSRSILFFCEEELIRIN